MQNDLQDSGLETLQLYLPRMNRLADLNLSGNSIAAGGAEVLRETLPQLPKLASVNIRGNDIAVPEMLQIAYSLSGNMLLKEFMVDTLALSENDRSEIRVYLPSARL